MKFLTKQDNSDDSLQRSSDNGTIVGSSVKIVGDLISEGDVQLDGILEGNIKVDGTVVIGISSQVKGGKVFGKKIIVSGTVNAENISSEELHILSSGKVFGNISVKVLGIEPGAVFVGKSEVLTFQNDDQVLIDSNNSSDSLE